MPQYDEGLKVIISGLPPTERSRFPIHEASSPPSPCWAQNERCDTETTFKR